MINGNSLTDILCPLAIMLSFVYLFSDLHFIVAAWANGEERDDI